MRFATAFLSVLAWLAPQLAVAGEQSDKYHVTAREKAACTADAMRLCMSAYPDEDKLLLCMKTNRASLSPTCQIAFDAGVRRRRL